MTRDILPYHLRRKRWKVPRQYFFTIHQEIKACGKQRSIRCRIPITLIMDHLNEESAVIQLQTGLPAFNGSHDYNKLQWIFARLMSLSSDLKIRTSRAGEIREILNKQHILKRWPALKEQISEMYENLLVDNLLRRHEQNLLHDFQVLYRREPMLQLLCNDLYRNYPEEAPVETKKMLVRHLGPVTLPLTERKQLTRLDARRHKAEITVDGIPDTDGIDREAVNHYLGRAAGTINEQRYRFNYGGTYQVDTRLGYILEATLQVEGAIGNAYQKCTTYNLKPINYE